MRLRAICLAVFIAASALGNDQVTVAKGMGQRLDDYLTRLEGFGFSGSMLVVQKGKVLLQKGYGYANREKRIRNQPNTVYDIGSLAKQFTATAILLLSRTGKLALNDPLGKYFEGVPPALAPVTIQHLLNHTSGVGSTVGYKEEVGRDAVVKRILDAKPKFKPGEQFQYSNEGYILLAAIVQKASGRPYQDFIKDNLFRPAGLTSTGFWGRRMAKVSPRRIATGYDEAGIEFEHPKAKAENWADMGGGQVTSTTGDLYRWYRTVFQSDFLTDSERKTLLTPAIPAKEPSAAWFSTDYGAGWFNQSLPDGRTRVHHGGDSFGFGACLARYVEDDLVIVNLCNVRHDMFPTHIRAERVIPQIIFDEKHPEPPLHMKQPSTFWRQLLGIYKLPSGESFTIYPYLDTVAIGADGQAATGILDQSPTEARTKIDGQHRIAIETLPLILTKDYPDLKKINVGQGFADGVYDEMVNAGHGLGSLRGLRVLGTYQGGFVDHTSITELKFERGKRPYKVQWSDGGVAATWVTSPPFAAQTQLQAASYDRLVGWSIITRRRISVDIERNGERIVAITISGPAGSGQAVRIER